MAIELGCASEFTVILTDRTLTDYLALLPWSQHTWSRVLDEVSEASVTVPDELGGIYCNIAPGISVQPWRYGIRIERDGDLVWAGPITGISRAENGEQVVISAKDKMRWLAKRTPSTDLSFDNVDAGLVFQSVLEDGLTYDNAFGLYCPSFETGYTMTRDVVAVDFEYVLDILYELGAAAVDWTVIGQELAVQEQSGDGLPQGWWVVRDGERERLATTRDEYGRYIFGMFTDDAFLGRPGYDIDGEAQANWPIVPGADSGEAGFRRFWTPTGGRTVDPDVGLLTYVDVNPLYRPQEGTPITADAVFQQRANSLYDLRNVAPVIINGGSLSERAPVTIDYLIPGSLWAIDLAERGIAELLRVARLKRVDVTVSRTKAGVTETIAPSLIPLGTDESEGG